MADRVGAAEAQREAIRVLLATRAQAVEFRTRALSALHALVTSAPDSLRERLRSLTLGELVQTFSLNFNRSGRWIQV